MDEFAASSAPTKFGIGQPIRRLEDVRLLTVYTDKSVKNRLTEDIAGRLEGKANSRSGCQSLFQSILGMICR